MKRVLALILTLMTVLSLCGCGAGTKTAALGETVSTDVMEVTVKKAALAYSAAGASYHSYSSTKLVSNIDEACEPADSGYYQTNKGRCLLCINFVWKNTDRATIDTQDCSVDFTVKQKGKSADVRGYDINDPDGWAFGGLDLSNMPVSVDGGDFKVNGTMNMRIGAGQSVEIKYVGVVGFEPDDLADPFEVVVSIPNSDGKRESFTYTVN